MTRILNSYIFKVYPVSENLDYDPPQFSLPCMARGSPHARNSASQSPIY